MLNQTLDSLMYNLKGINEKKCLTKTNKLPKAEVDPSFTLIRLRCNLLGYLSLCNITFSFLE